MQYWGMTLNAFIFTVRPTVHTNPSRKWRLSKTFFKPEKYSKNAAGLFVLVWTENIKETEIF